MWPAYFGSEQRETIALAQDIADDLCAKDRDPEPWELEALRNALLLREEHVA